MKGMENIWREIINSPHKDSQFYISYIFFHQLFLIYITFPLKC